MARQDEGGIGFDITRAFIQVLVDSTMPAVVCSSRYDAFDAMRLPSVSIEDYMRRLERYCCCSKECFALSLVYLQRVLDSNRDFKITELNVHRLLLAAIITAAKVQDDDFYSNAYYSKVGGVCPEELLTLEAEFMLLLGWRCHVTVEDFEACLERLRQGKFELQSLNGSASELPPPNSGSMEIEKTPAAGPTIPPEAMPKAVEPEAPAAAEPTIPPAELEGAMPKTVEPEATVVAGLLSPASPAESEGAGTDATSLQQMSADHLVDADIARKAAALAIGDHSSQRSTWSRDPCRLRRRSATPVTHLNARRTRLCLVVH